MAEGERSEETENSHGIRSDASFANVTDWTTSLESITENKRKRKRSGHCTG